jgi:hypothetical protein
MSEKLLHNIFNKYGSDNAYLGYADYLEPYCNKLKNIKFDLLEIGIGGHNINLPSVGLQALEEYFKKAKIYGIDLNNKERYDNKRIKTLKGSQFDIKTINKFKKLAKNLKIVFDDGSHIPKHQIFTFLNLFPHMTEGGFYAIADIEYSYSNKYAGININNKKNILNFFKPLIHYVNSDLIFDNYLREKKIFDSIKSIQFHHGIIIIEKGKNKPKQTKYLKLLELNKKNFDLSEKRNKKGNIKYKETFTGKNISFQTTHEALKNHNIFIPEETSFIESKVNKNLKVRFKFEKKLKIKFYKIYPSIFTPSRAPSRWTYKIFSNKKFIEKDEIKLNHNSNNEEYYKFKTSKFIDEIIFDFSDNLSVLNQNKSNIFEKLKMKLKNKIKKELKINKNNSNKIIRINKIYFFDDKKINILERKILINFIKNLKIEVN